MVDFAGWSMPVQYGSIVAEHQATRQAAGLFDVSHMGRLRLDGSGAAAFLDRLLTRKVVGMEAGQDPLLARLQRTRRHPRRRARLSPAGARRRAVSPARGQRQQPRQDRRLAKITLEPSDDVRLTDRTIETAMIAVQGPRRCDCVEPLVGTTIGGLAYYTGTETTICGQPGIVSRTGYTGEDGCELIVPAAAAVEVWEKVSLRAKTPA